MKLLAVFCMFAACAYALKTYRGDQVLRINPSTEEQIQFLQNLEEKYELDFWKPIRAIAVPVDVRVPSNYVASFKAALSRIGLDFQIFIDDVQTLIDAERNSHPAPKDLASFDYGIYHTFDEIQQWIDDVATEYSNLATKSFVGTSFEGRSFSALTISTKAGNPQFVINCGIHAREWITPATCMYSANQLLTQYGTDTTTTDLLDQVDFVFIPSSNPDGYEYTWTDDRMWRKTRSVKDGQTCVGVDPNRNWDAGFGGSGASPVPCSETYHGPQAFSETCVHQGHQSHFHNAHKYKRNVDKISSPGKKTGDQVNPCTLAQKNFVEDLPNVKMYIDVHAYSQLWMFSYGYTTARPSNFVTLARIAQDSVAAIQATHGMYYEPGQVSTTIYVASGITTDYFYENLTPCSFTSELRDTGRYGFLLPERLIIPTAEESFAAFQVMAQAIVDGQCESY